MTREIKFQVVRKVPEPIVEKTSAGISINNYGNMNVSGGENKSSNEIYFINFWKYRTEGFIAGLAIAVIIEIFKSPIIGLLRIVINYLKGVL